MTATVHSLFAAVTAEQEVPAHPLVKELSALALERLEELLRRMLDSADDRLFELSERAPNDTERRNYFDTMRVVRLDRARIASTFLQQVAAGFHRDAATAGASLDDFNDIDSLSIQPTDELEEKIALTNMSAKAEAQNRSVLWEIEQRRHALETGHGVRLSPQALNPARICEAFGSAIATLDCDIRVKLVIYKLFDRMVMQELEPIFAAALEVFEQHGIRGGRWAANPRPRSRADAGAAAGSGIGVDTPAASLDVGAAPGPGSGHDVIPAAPMAGARSVVDALLSRVPGRPASLTRQPALDLLRGHGLDPAILMQSRDPAAIELGTALQTLLGLPTLSAVQASTQRLSMASGMFEQLLTDPLLPSALRPALEGLRYPAYRAALTEDRFLTDAAHPLRQTIAELIDLVVAHQTGDLPAATFNDTLKRLQLQTAATGAISFSTLAATRQLPVVEVDRFAKQLRDHARSLRESMLARVRQQVSRQIDLHTLTRPPPPAPVEQLLRSGVGPLLAIRLLRDGRVSEPFQQADTLVDRILDSLEFAPPPQPVQLIDREKLCSDIAGSFRDIGMAADKIETLLNGLLEVYAGLDRPAADAADADAIDAPAAAQAAVVPAAEFAAGPAEAAPAAEDGLPQAAAETGLESSPETLTAAPLETSPETSPKTSPKTSPEWPTPAATAAADPAPPAAASAPDATAAGDVLPPVTAAELLTRVLLPESWFRVFDAARQQTRWLKLASFYVQQDSVTFSGFDESTRLVLRASRFAEDLVAGHSEPINPTDGARQALEQLRQAKARGLL